MVCAVQYLVQNIQGSPIETRTTKCTLIFQLSFKQKQNWLLRVKKQSISSVWDNFIICTFNTWIHITRFVKTLKSNKNTMYVIMTQIVYTNYAVHLWIKMICYNLSNRLYGPNSPDWTRLITLYIGLCSRACIVLRFPAWTISKTEWAPAERILTNRPSTKLLITGNLSFLNVCISQSNVWKFYKRFIGNFILFLAVKKFRQSVNNWQSYKPQNKVAPFLANCVNSSHFII